MFSSLEAELWLQRSPSKHGVSADLCLGLNVPTVRAKVELMVRAEASDGNETCECPTLPPVAGGEPGDAERYGRRTAAA